MIFMNSINGVIPLAQAEPSCVYFIFLVGKLNLKDLYLVQFKFAIVMHNFTINGIIVEIIISTFNRVDCKVIFTLRDRGNLSVFECAFTF